MAMPLVVSSLSVTVMTFVDRIFLNWVSGTVLSAAFSGGVVWWAAFCLPLGICGYANTFVAQYHGDGQANRIGPSVWQAVWMAVFATPFALCLIPLAPWLFSLADHSAEATQYEIEYFQILCLGGPGLLIAAALSSFYSGRGKTWVVMLVDGGVTVVNVILDYLWIFGHGGFSEMGIAGAAWATTVSLWLKVAIYLLLVLQREHRDTYQMAGGMRFDRALFGRLFYFGGPSGVQMLLDVAGFTVFIMLVAHLGENEATATTLAFSISSVAFMPIWGFSIGLGVLVGQHLGEDRDDLAERSTWTSLQISMGYMAVVSILYILVPSAFLEPFYSGGNGDPATETAVRAMATNLLCFVAAYNLCDAMFMIFVGAVKGAGDTRFILWVSCAMGILLAGSSWLLIEVLHVGIYGCWLLVTSWVCGMGVIFLFRFLQGKWRSMRVIETETMKHGITRHELGGAEVVEVGSG